MNDFTNTIVRKRDDFEDWKYNNICDLGGDIIYQENTVKNIEYLSYFYRTIKEILVSNGYTIINEKEFRNKIGSLLYKISE